MTNKNTGGPAFPMHPNMHPADECKGMTLRDWFAGQALVQLLSSNYVADCETGRIYTKFYAETAYEIADTMLAERGVA